MSELKRARWWTLVVLACAIAIGGFYLDVRYDRLSAVARQSAFSLAVAQSDSLRQQLVRSISAVHALAAVIDLNGYIPDFPALAADIIASYGGISNLQLAPGGVISQIYPPSGHERAIGLDLLDPATPGRDAAVRAQQLRTLTVTGPLKLVQGGTAVIARRPVYLTTVGGQKLFWGFVTALIEIDVLLRDSRLDRLAASGFRYQLSKVTGERSVPFAGDPLAVDERAVRFRFDIYGGTWELALAAVNGWVDRTAIGLDVAVIVGGGLLAVFLVWWQLRRPVLLAAEARQQTLDLDDRNRELQARIDERGRIEASLRASERRQQALLAQATVAWLVYDHRGRFVEVNPEACRMLGYRREELLALSINEIEVTRSAGELEKLLENVPSSDPVGYTGRWRAAAGREFPVDVRLRSFRGDHEEPQLFVAVARDMSRREAVRVELERINAELESTVNARTSELLEVNRSLTEQAHVRRRAEQALQQAKQAAEQANEAKSRFLAVISHEIRTPMNGLLGMLDLLRGGALNRQQQAYVDLADASGKLLMELLGELVDMSRIEFGAPRLTIRDVALAPLFEQVVGLHRWRANQKGLALELILDHSLPGSLRTDPLRLRQVVHNLLSNAVKFTDSGRIEVRVAMRRDGELQCEVEDSGVGIDAAAQQRIFDSFSQADVTIARRYGGTGLGLSISRQLVEALGGSITLASRPGEGSRFTVVIPVASVADVVEGDTEQDDGDVFGTRVLVVEDNAVNRQVAEGMLRRLGCRCFCTANGQLALDFLARERVDLVLMDIQMPILDGLEATRRWRLAEGSAARLPIIAMTAHVLPEDITRCLDAGMDDHLAKPVTYQALRSTLIRWRGARRAGLAGG